MILVFGSINVDLVARVPIIPRPGETVLSPSYETLFGGKGANQAVAAARASQGRGVEVAIAAQLGNDEFGRAALANLQANGVRTDFVELGEEPTGCAFITVEDSGENAITVASGANAALTAAAVTYAFDPSDLLVLQMEIPFSEALAVARRARLDGARVVWNFAPAPLGFAATNLRALLATTDIFVVNELEVMASAVILGRTLDDPEAAAAFVAEQGSTLVILTAGARGAAAFMPDGVRSGARAPTVNVVDTTGAGDTFVGVLAAELVEGRAIAPSLRRACLGGSIACQSTGAQSGMPSRAMLDQRSQDWTIR